MAAAFLRSPRFTLFIVVVICGSLLVLAPPFSNRAAPFTLVDEGLASRLARSDKIYNATLRNRKELIKKYGPSPEDIALFPPDTPPRPPYTVWDFFPASYNCPHELVRIGALGDGGKWVCGLSRVVKKPGCVVYSIVISLGINHESSFEADILKNTDDCRIWGYDFSVRKFGPQIPILRWHRTYFKPYALGGQDKHEATDDPKMYTLNTLMKQNGHTHIDILKIDIEGWEFDTLTALIQPYVDSGTPLPFGQLQLEVHLWSKNFPQFLKWWEILESAGLRPFMTEPNLVYLNYNPNRMSDLAEYSFLNTKGENVFTHNPHQISLESGVGALSE
ncbi:hypothetical protein HGRIS_006171 [Hohenbuehelia grisea]|uniref:Methyltransferase domain-containing protein n=1 Tax=Hohenbuehelia grisea TaxID=104357 RepID=A0ABR3JZ15_9AGAR